MDNLDKTIPKGVNAHKLLPSTVFLAAAVRGGGDEGLERRRRCAVRIKTDRVKYKTQMFRQYYLDRDRGRERERVKNLPINLLLLPEIKDRFTLESFSHTKYI